MPKVLKITTMQCLRKNLVMKLMFCMLINMKVFYKVIVFFDGYCKACPSYPGKFAISLWHLKKLARNEVRDSTELAGSDTTLTIYFTSNVLSTLTLFLSQYEIHAKSFLHFINGLCNISSLLF